MEVVRLPFFLDYDRFEVFSFIGLLGGRFAACLTVVYMQLGLAQKYLRTLLKVLLLCVTVVRNA